MILLYAKMNPNIRSKRRTLRNRFVEPHQRLSTTVKNPFNVQAVQDKKGQ
jgi:hypothetical protein